LGEAELTLTKDSARDERDKLVVTRGVSGRFAETVKEVA